MSRLFAILAAAATVLVGASAASAASTLQVNAATGVDSPTCGTATPCRTIGQAVANASDGDTIQVAAGTYDESVTVPPGAAGTVDVTGATALGSATRSDTYDSSSTSQSSAIAAR